MIACDATNTNVRAYLKLLRFAENQLRDDDQVYYGLFGGGTFTDTSKHPNKLVTIGKYSSTAAGAYQILYKTWLEARTFGIVTDFSPASQGAIAFSKLQSRGALQSICAGDLHAAIARPTQEWVSLPGGTQSRMLMSVADDRFKLYVDELAK